MNLLKLVGCFLAGLVLAAGCSEPVALEVMAAAVSQNTGSKLLASEQTGKNDAWREGIFIVCSRDNQVAVIKAMAKRDGTVVIDTTKLLPGTSCSDGPPPATPVPIK